MTTPAPLCFSCCGYHACLIFATYLQAKFLVQILVSGTQLVGRAFARAIREEMQASQAAAAARQGQGGQESRRKAAADAITGMSIQVSRGISNANGKSSKMQNYILW